MNVLKWVVGLPVALFALVFLVGALSSMLPASGYSSAPVGSGSGSSTVASDECWKGYERKSNTADEKIAIAKFCEGLQASGK